MEQWERDKRAADRFVPEAQRVLAAWFIRPATLDEDRLEATDLRVFSVKQLTVAWRNRDASYLERYPHDVTIRLSRPSGAKSEWDKIVDGWGHVLLYSFGDATSLTFAAWRLIDLDGLRAQLIRGPKPAWRDRRNHDGSSDFRAVDVRSLTAGVQLDKSAPLRRSA